MSGSQHPIAHGRPGHPGGHGSNSAQAPRLVAWEVTRACNLACVHCRASAMYQPDPNQLSTDEGIKLIDEIADMGPGIILILTGGEPMMREDIFDLAEYGNRRGLRVVMAPNGTLLTLDAARRMKAVGIQRISVSIDGATAEEHDKFRGVPEAFSRLMDGLECARQAGLEFQVNTTVTRRNMASLDAIQDLVSGLGAAAHHIFLLVPTGRGKDLEAEIITAEEYEKVLNWFYDRRKVTSMQLKATCAPHYHRILRQRAKADGQKVDFQTFGLDAVSRGCLGGQGFVFVSHTGQVQPCGYLDLDCGQLRERSFTEIYRQSPVFLRLRDKSCYQGKCGVCEYWNVCGGCRARSFAATGDYLTEEPLCLYQPASAGRETAS